ncbi:MAG: hypothetical protein VXW32_02240 [Myxococcota bacterium]|nr:hypothetical protein [Myxococcota bacterium]
MLSPHAQSPETLMAAFWMGLAVVLLGAVMLLKPEWFKRISRARLAHHGGLPKKEEETWKRWHNRSAVFCILVGMVVSLTSLGRVLRPVGPFAPGSSMENTLSAFSMECETMEVRLRNQHESPIWIRLAQPSVFGVASLHTEDLVVQNLDQGFVLNSAVEDSHQVALRTDEFIPLAVGEEVAMPLFGVSSADCGGGVASLSLSPQGRELAMEDLQKAVSQCNRLQVQLALYDDPEAYPAFAGWRGCEIRP